MIIDRFETYEVQKIGDNLMMLNGDLYVYIKLIGFELLINTENENFIIANSISGVGVSYYTGAITGVKFTATTSNYLLLETGDFMLLEDGGKIILQMED